jgi:acyl-CoA thioester hydrolase
MEAAGVILPVIEATCQYRRPSRYDDELEIRTTGRLTTPVRVEFDYEVMIKGQTEPIATGRTRHAAITPDGKPCRLPSRIVEVFS